MATPKINKNVKSYFDQFPKALIFFFTPDETGVPFSVEAQAVAHNAGLIKKGNKTATVVTITRADVDAWWPMQAVADVILANKALAAAQAANDAAVEAQAALTAKDGVIKKGKADKAVKDTETALVKADATLQKAGEALYESLLAHGQAKMESVNAGGNAADIKEMLAALAALKKGGVALAIESALPIAAAGEKNGTEAAVGEPGGEAEQMAK
jgi:hypothetical protein